MEEQVPEIILEAIIQLIGSVKDDLKVILRKK